MRDVAWKPGLGLAFGMVEQQVDIVQHRLGSRHPRVEWDGTNDKVEVRIRNNKALERAAADAAACSSLNMHVLNVLRIYTYSLNVADRIT